MIIMREVFEAQAGSGGVCVPLPRSDPDEVFYTITQADKGKRYLDTEAGRIDVEPIMGVVLAMDVGRRLYRQPDGDWTEEKAVEYRQRTST